MNKGKKHLFICAIGPVQDFIATARTSQDLWFGSWLLSELSKAAALAVFDNAHQLIFPAPEHREDLEAGTILNVVNKIVAIIEGDPKMIADRVWQTVQERLENLRQEAFAHKIGRIDNQLAKVQINDLVEFYWVSVPYISSQDYRLVRAKAEALLTARKNTRNFQQIEGRQGIPKSSLDGFRESVLSDNVKDIYAAYHAARGEILSGIDLLKRWGQIRGRTTFPSTTDFAVQPFLIMIGKEKEQALLRRIKTLLATYTACDETDGTYFYVERLVQLISEDANPKAFSDEFAKIFREEDIRQRPSPYYVLLRADGDNMGKAIDAQDSPEKHRALSQELSVFAQEAKRIIEKFGGVPIYVGGDDVLAYLPLHTALKCVIALNEQFKQAMQGFEFVDEKGSHSPTLSGALVIAHHLTPLRDVLDMAREAEKKAKGLTGKNGLVIVSSKRGGTERTVKAKMSDLVGRMEILIGYTRQKQISAGAAYELQKLHQELSDAALTGEVFEKEAVRIIQRKREAGGGQEVQKQIQQQFETWFRDDALALDELAQEMIIAGEFAGAYDMAFGAIKREVQV